MIDLASNMDIERFVKNNNKYFYALSTTHI